MDASGTIHRFAAGVASSIETNDFDVFCAHIADWRLDHQVLGRQPPVSRLQTLQTKIIQFGSIQHSSAYSSQGAAPAGTVSFLVTAVEEKPVTFRGRVGGSLDLHAASPGTEFELICPLGSDHVVTTAPAADIDHMALDLLGHPLAEPAGLGGLRFPNQEARLRYIGILRATLSEVQQQPRILDDPRLAQLLADRLLGVLLLGLVQEPPREQFPYRRLAARRARRYILDRLEDPPSVRELCRVSGANYATLERGFKETYGLSPRAHLKALRLAQVRRHLRNPDKTTTVTGVALRWGFFELGRFAGEYRRRFGESPIETLRKSASSRR